MKKFNLVFLTPLLLFVFSGFLVKAQGVNKNLNYKHFLDLPVLHEGRVKPLSTFSEVHLRFISGKALMKTGDVKNTSIEWLAELLFTSDESFHRDVFRIDHPDVVEMLELDRVEGHRYSFVEVFSSLQKISGTINSLNQKERKLLTPAQNNLLDVYGKALRVYEISRTFSLLEKEYMVRSEEAAKTLGLEVGRVYSYMELLRTRNKMLKVSSELKKKDKGKLSKAEEEILSLSERIGRSQQDSNSRIFRVIPPQWEKSDSNKGEGLWFSLWGIVQSGQGSPESAKLFAEWEKLGNAYREGDSAEWERISRKLWEMTVVSHQHVSGVKSKLSIESFYNKIDFFMKSIVFYILSFLLLALSWIWRPKLFAKISLYTLFVGGIFHFLGVVLRMYIMGRPPVSTLYESVIFVGLIGVIFSLIIEVTRKNGLGLLIGSLMGAMLHFVGFGYLDNGDSMGMLVAVLNTNFWLATHVVCITIGYGCCFVGGLLGHVYIVQRYFNPKSDQLPSLYKNMLGVSLFALFFSMFGTILGGIWADQSWGRFWGWDPKENGAMLIVLWLLMLIHGRLSGIIREVGYALGMVFTNIIVVLAWFGVNLLGVGLHSYGFTDSILMNIVMFSGFELLFGLGFYLVIKAREAGAKA